MGIFQDMDRRRSLFVRISLIILVVYSAASVNLLIIAAGWQKNRPGAFLNIKTLFWFSVISFLLAAAVSAYHLSNLFRRRKRRSDRTRLSRARFVRAKHRRPRRDL
jgi:membrane protein implicated in regulation of membrane protease activity